MLSSIDFKYSLLPPALPISDPKMEWGMAFVGTATAVLASSGSFSGDGARASDSGLVIGSLLIGSGGRSVGWPFGSSRG